MLKTLPLAYDGSFSDHNHTLISGNMVLVIFKLNYSDLNILIGYDLKDDRLSSHANFIFLNMWRAGAV